MEERMIKEIKQDEMIEKNLRLAFELGYKRAEQGMNIQAALADFEEIFK